MHRFAAMVGYLAAVAAHTAAAASSANEETPPTALMRVLSSVRRQMAPLRSDQNSLIPLDGVLAAVFAVPHVAWFLKLERF
jgi:hypothetical protein